jgi:hypothetical protein
MDKIEMNLLEIGWSGMDCIGLVQDSDNWRAFLNAIMKLNCTSLLNDRLYEVYEYQMYCHSIPNAENLTSS